MATCVRYIVNNVNDSIDFYTRHLGFKLEMHPAPPFAEISRDDLHMYLTETQSRAGGGAPMPSGEQQTPGGWNRVHLIVDDLDGLVTRLRSEQCTFRNEIVQGVGGKQILLQDPSGNLIELFQPNTAAFRTPGSGPSQSALTSPTSFTSTPIVHARCRCSPAPVGRTLCSSLGKTSRSPTESAAHQTDALYPARMLRRSR
jgi:catechol 2,3-dioxygenase-like lactoylglutathione lyase family enzyme